LHERDQLLTEAQCCEGVGLEGAANRLKLGLEDTRAWLPGTGVRENPGIVDEGVDAPEVLLQQVPQLAYGLGGGNVQPHEAHVRAVFGQLLGGGAALRIAAGGEHDTPTLGRELAGGLKPEPAVSASDDGDGGCGHGELLMVVL
jgi:hypothetical protein